ncbi:MAG: c-type cytochrome [Ignavibacteriaceae bacterium]|nr:c-type cytochrome [Ignavibacteriaceae bacterium]
MSFKNKFLSLSKSLIIILFAVFYQNAFAQSTDADLTKAYYDIVGVAILLVLILIVIGFLFFGMGEGVKRESKFSLGLDRIKNYIVGLKPIEKEKDMMLDHSYDEIHELNNNIPPWFSYLFWLTVVFSIFYMINYHVLSSGDVQASEYNEEVKLAELKKTEMIKSGALLDESKLTALTDAASLSSGKEIFIKNCAVCHTEKGGGLVGPNLTDDYWIHGSGIKNIFATVKNGVPAKGMISWKSQLNPRQIQEVSSFILTLRGTNPPNPKAPEGILYAAQDSTKN